jgi:outer membrane protein assembly factor BamB
VCRRLAVIGKSQAGRSFRKLGQTFRRPPQLNRKPPEARRVGIAHTARMKFGLLARRRFASTLVLIAAGCAARLFAADLAPLPKPVTSFGAAATPSHLWLFGGHHGPAHKYHRATTLGTLWQAPLTGGAWEAVAERPIAQGASLVVHDGQLIAVSGMAPLNAEGEKEELRSLDSVARFDPATRRWTELPPLPTPRSSHDSVILDGKLYVGGGWQLRGGEGKPVWAKTLDVLDLRAAKPEWRSLEQPFRRRALAAVAHAGKLYFIGGMDNGGDTSSAVDIFNPATGQWSAGPALPEGRMNGFGCAAAELDGRLYASPASGVVLRLSADAKSWETAGQLEPARMFHRLVPHAGKLLVVGGSANRERIAAIGEFAPDAKPQTPNTKQANWPAFRGDGSSVTAAQSLPLRWSETENLRWRVELPGYGQSSPIVWNGVAYVTSVAGPRKETLLVTAHDLATGAERWRFTAESSAPEADSDMRSKAAPTPCASADGVFALFESGDVFALTHEGKLRWQKSLTKEFGAITGNHGAGGSPVLAGGKLIVLLDQKTPSLLLALDPATGAVQWKTARAGRVYWSTPLVAARDGRTELIVSGGGTVAGYDAADGRELWSLDGLERNSVPSPTLGAGRLLISSGNKGSNWALDWRGAAAPAVAWKANDTTTSFSSPLIHQGRAYFVSKAGVLYCHAVDSGKLLFEERLREGCWASPVGAGEHVFLFGEKGVTTVLAAADTFRAVATNSLPVEKPVHGVAATDGAWVVRSHRQLLCLGAKPEPGSARVAAR